MSEPDEQAAPLPVGSALGPGVFLARFHFGGADAAEFAAGLTAVGLPTTASTVHRLDAAKQPPTVEQLLLIGLLTGGLRTLLVESLPFTVGTLTVDTKEHVDALLGYAEKLPPEAVAMHAAVVRAVGGHRDGEVARSVAAPLDRVETAAHDLYGRPTSLEVFVRWQRRCGELGIDELDSRESLTVRSHAIRAVTREIREHLGRADG